MRSRWYIEARAGESWDDVSNLFCGWLETTGEAARLKSFGFSEGDKVTEPETGKTLLAFHFPEHHGERIQLFERWAQQTDRLYAFWENDAVHFPGQRIPAMPLKLPVGMSWPPPWITGTIKAEE